MDERQQQIKAGAGLEESRVNQDLIDFLQKWGSWILMALAVAALIYAGLQWLERQRVAKINEAFAAYEGAGGGANPNPDALRRVADEYEGVKSVAELARITSADVLLESVRLGVRPGAQINNDGSVGIIDDEGNANSEGELLSEEERGRYLDQAQSLYGAVLESTRGVAGKQTLAINAMFGLAAVHETRGEADRARQQLDEIATLADESGYPAIAVLARQRAESVTSEPAAPLLSRDQLPELPTPPAPETPGLTPGADPSILAPVEDLETDAEGDDAEGDDAEGADNESQPTEGDETAGDAEPDGDDAAPADDAGGDDAGEGQPDQP